MNNGPRQALALNNPSLCFTLCFTFSVSKSNHKLFLSEHTFLYPSNILSIRGWFLLPESPRLHLSHPLVFASNFIIALVG